MWSKANEPMSWSGSQKQQWFTSAGLVGSIVQSEQHQHWWGLMAADADWGWEVVTAPLCSTRLCAKLCSGISMYQGELAEDRNWWPTRNYKFKNERFLYSFQDEHLNGLLQCLWPFPWAVDGTACFFIKKAVKPTWQRAQGKAGFLPSLSLACCMLSSLLRSILTTFFSSLPGYAILMWRKLKRSIRKIHPNIKLRSVKITHS